MEKLSEILLAGSGAGLVLEASQDADFTAEANRVYPVEGGVKVTLPSGASNGAWVILINDDDSWAVSPVVVRSGGASIGGVPGSVLFSGDVTGASFLRGAEGWRAWAQTDTAPASISASIVAAASMTAVLAPDVTFDDDAIAIFDAMDVEPNAARKARIDAAVVALKDDGIWSKLDRLWVMAGHDSQAARLDWKAPATSGRMLTPVNSPTFTADQGYTGNGSNMYLNSNYTPSTDGSSMVQNSAAFGVWVRDVGTAGTKSFMGVLGGSGSIIRRRGDSNTWQTIGPNGPSTPVDGAVNSSSATGLLSANRSGSSAQQAYRNGASEGTSTGTSESPPNRPFYLLAFNQNGSAAQFSEGQISIAFCGGSLTATEHDDLYDILNAYMTGLADDYS